MAHDEANQLTSVITDLAPTYWGGVIGDDLVPADYGGDGSADLGAFRPSEAIWYLKDSAAGAESGGFPPGASYVPGFLQRNLGLGVPRWVAGTWYGGSVGARWTLHDGLFGC